MKGHGGIEATILQGLFQRRVAGLLALDGNRGEGRTSLGTYDYHL